MRAPGRAPAGVGRLCVAASIDWQARGEWMSSRIEFFDAGPSATRWDAVR